MGYMASLSRSQGCWRDYDQLAEVLNLALEVTDLHGVWHEVDVKSISVMGHVRRTSVLSPSNLLVRVPPLLPVLPFPSLSP